MTHAASFCQSTTPQMLQKYSVRYVQTCPTAVADLLSGFVRPSKALSNTWTQYPTTSYSILPLGSARILCNTSAALMICVTLLGFKYMHLCYNLKWFVKILKEFSTTLLSQDNL